jgi:CBS domain-containing protein
MSEIKKSFSEFYETQLKDVMQAMSTDSPCVDETASVTEVFSLLMNTECIWVVDHGDPRRLVGVITESDALPLLSPPVTSLQTFDKPDARSLQFGGQLTAQDMMTKNPVTTGPEETIREAITKMKLHTVKKLPVVNQEGLLLGDVALRQFIDIYRTEVA